MKKVGIFAGSFDPIHHGHVAFALGAANVAGLDKVFFLPEASPRGKSTVTPLKHRLAMIKLATQPYKQLNVISLDDVQFTVAKTLPKLLKKFPIGQLYFLVGSDVLKGLPKWPGVGELKKSTKIIAGQRANAKNPKPDFEGTTIYTYFADLSSREIRSQLGKGERPHGLEPKVTDYIQKNQLYA